MAGCGPNEPGARSEGERAGTAPRLPLPTSLPSDLRFTHLGTEDGLPQLDVLTILQDSLGFIWMGTEGGLVRYDGQRVRVFRPEPFDSTSISNSWVTALAVESSGHLWAATEGDGLNRYDPSTEAFAHIELADGDAAPAALWGMVQNPDGVLWLGRRFEGVTRYDPRTGETVEIRGPPDTPNGLSSLRLPALTGSQTGGVWVGTEDGGLHHIDAAGGVRHVPPPSGSGTFGQGVAIRALLEDSTGRLWVGTDGNGLVLLDPQTLAATPFRPRRGALVGEAVTSLFEDPTGALWVGTDGGLNRLDPETASVTAYQHDPADRTSLGAGSVLSMFIDRSGTFWVGTQSGVSRFVWRAPQIERVLHDADDPSSISGPNTWSVLEDRQGVLWVGTERGLDRVDPETGAITHYTHDPADPTTLASGWVMSIYEDRAGRLWVGTRGGGLNQFDRETGRATRYVPDPEDPTALPTDNPWNLFEDRAGQIWVLPGGSGCLSRLDPDAGTFEPLCLEGEPPEVKQVVELEDGILWLATWDYGLWRVDTRTGDVRTWRHDPADAQTPSSDYVMTLDAGLDGALWLGTYGAGLSRFDPETEQFTHYTLSTSEIPDDVIYDSLVDDDGFVWITSNRGLARLDPETGTFWTFGMEDGLQNLEFNAGTGYRAPDGTFYVGGIAGFNRFDPEAIRPDPTAPRTVLTEVQVDDQPADEGLDGAAPVARTLRTRPGARDLTLSYAALHYVAPDRNRFRVRLAGYDDWHTTSDASATYTNLSPGAYTFRVASANPDGVWGPDATLAITVVPPWWRSWWAYGLYALMAVGLAVALVRVRRNQLRMQHQLEIEYVEAEQLRQLDRSKSAFFANVSHEFRTPLTLTLGPLDDVLAGEQGPVSEAARSSLALARRSAGRVLDLINQMLDVARLEAGQTPLRARPLRLGDVARAQTEAFHALAAQKEIAVDLHVPEAPVEVMADPEHLATILSNLLSNAFKFTPTRGTVRVRVESDATAARIVVRDSGPGIPEADLPHVFDRFYQVRSDRGQRPLGTGIGLALAHELAALHGGSLVAESEEGFGSTFTLALPLGREHLAPEQIADAPVEAPRRPARAAEPSGDRQDAEAAPLLAPAEADDDDVPTVLMVEDHPDIRDLVRTHLQRAGYRVEEAPDGEAGLAAARRLVPDLILSDVMMPKMDGIELCRALKADPETNFIPVILLTAKAAQEDRLEGLREHADAYLVKPFDPAELLARIEGLIAVRLRLRERFRIEGMALVLGEEPAPPTLHAQAIEVEPAETVFLDLVRDAIAAHLGDATFSVQRLADEANVSRGHLHRQLVALTGQTPTAAIRTMRLERAAQLLAARAGTVSEVAYAVGFKSVSHFSKAFLDFTGSRPSEYPEAG